MTDIVLICGGRQFGHLNPFLPKEEFKRRLGERIFAFLWLRTHILPLNPRIIGGLATGADDIGKEWAAYWGLDFDPYPADWDKHGKKAGALRNVEMLKKGKPTKVVAFPGGSGTAHMVRIAKEAGVEVLEIEYPTGQQTRTPGVQLSP